jgi:hypothetical protein
MYEIPLKSIDQIDEDRKFNDLILFFLMQLTVKESPATITALYAGTHYEIQMAASNENGSSLMSAKVVFLTYG